MKRLIAISITVIFGVATLLAATEFWQTKPYTSWSGKEIKAITSSSPWAQTARSSRLALKALDSVELGWCRAALH